MKQNIVVRFVRGVKEVIVEIFGDEWAEVVFWLLGLAIFFSIFKVLEKLF